jgi:type IV pilus biogenesis protein CpaD/CtpE
MSLQVRATVASAHTLRSKVWNRRDLERFAIPTKEQAQQRRATRESLRNGSLSSTSRASASVNGSLTGSVNSSSAGLRAAAILAVAAASGAPSGKIRTLSFELSAYLHAVLWCVIL